MKAVALTSALLLSTVPMPFAGQACIQATQKLQVPEQIHLVGACQNPPETHPKLTFLLSESGIDVYRVQRPRKTAASPAEEMAQAYADTHPEYPLRVTALFVFQDEQERQVQVRSLMNSGEAIRWLRGGPRYDSTLPADWTPALSIKYVTYTFTILGRNSEVDKEGAIVAPKEGSNSVLLIESHMYAPQECYAYGTRCVNSDKLDWDSAPNFKSSEIATYINPSPDPLPQDSLAYRAAMMLGKLRIQEGRRSKK